MGIEENNINSSRPSRSWIIVLLLTCAGIGAYNYFYSQNRISNLNYLTGYYVPIAFIIWGFFHIAVGRKHNRNLAVLSFVAIYSSLIAGGLINSSQTKDAQINAVTEIQKEYSSMVNSIVDEKGMPKRVEKVLDTTPKAKGEIGEFERYMKILLNKVATQRNDYLLEIEAIGWKNILDPERIKKDATLAESKLMLRKAKEIVAKYKTKSYALLENARQDITKLEINEDSKREMLNGFDKSLLESRSKMDAVWDLEAKVVSEFENIFTLLGTRKGGWVVQEGQLLFVNQNDLNTFNSYLGAIREDIEKQQAIQKQNIASTNNTFNELKK